MTIDDLVDSISAEGPCWLWIGASMRNGDLYHACAFAGAFRDQHGYDLPIHLIVGNPRIAKIAELFGEHFASIRIHPDFAPTERDWREFFLRRELPNFGPNVPIVLHPHINAKTSLLHRFFGAERTIWGQIYKFLLDLPADVEPAAPAADPVRERDAADFLTANGMVADKSMVLFPYAQSFLVAAMDHFAELAAEATRRGWTVVTSVAPGETPVLGTRPVFIPFDLLLDVADQAGWIVGVRSGICDIVSSARCRKTVIFRQKNELPNWGLAPLELAHDATEIAFPLLLEGPRAFAARVLDDPAGDYVDLAPWVLSDALRDALGPSAVETINVADAQRGLEYAAPKRLFGRKKDGPARMINLPQRRHPRWGPLIAAEIDDFVRSRRSSLFYACRDRAGVMDFFEEVDPSSLVSGHYWAADYWHTILAVPSPGLVALLAPAIQRKILPRTPMEIGHFHKVGDVWNTPSHYDFCNGDRPVDVAGLQLLAGWSDLEPWGAWSKGDRSVLKFTLPSTPTAPHSLELNCLLGVTQRGGLLALRARVNGRLLLSRDLSQSEDGELRITIPADAMPNATAYIELEHPGSQSPKMRGESDDERRIAVGLRSVTLKHGL